ncbi:MAG: hypothetical protein RMJ67_09185 [Elusimicrobiota bacterium]|nr:hypothetical protein [Endomicrobiia bacterium]MDW8166669.1 hypothetical protein [Elusimicrobiota bacterium]
MTKGAYSLFELGQASLSYENILAICELLGINDMWIKGESDIFLYSNDILYLKAKNKEMLHRFMMFASKANYLHIIKSEVEYLQANISKILRDEYVVTFLRFENETYCVLLTPNLRTRQDFHDYFEKAYENLEKLHIQYSFCFLENFETKKEILAKIEKRMITKADIERLYNLADIANMNLSLSVEEKNLILKLREKKIEAVI